MNNKLGTILAMSALIGAGAPPVKDYRVSRKRHGSGTRRMNGRAATNAKRLAARLPLGCIVATGVLADCVSVEAVPRDDLLRAAFPFALEERFLGNYSYGRFAWRFDDVQMLRYPIPETGRQGFWKVCLEVARSCS